MRGTRTRVLPPIQYVQSLDLVSHLPKCVINGHLISENIKFEKRKKETGSEALKFELIKINSVEGGTQGWAILEAPISTVLVRYIN